MLEELLNNNPSDFGIASERLFLINPTMADGREATGSLRGGERRVQHSLVGDHVAVLPLLRMPSG